MTVEARISEEDGTLQVVVPSQPVTVLIQNMSDMRAELQSASQAAVEVSVPGSTAPNVYVVNGNAAVDVRIPKIMEAVIGLLPKAPYDAMNETLEIIAEKQGEVIASQQVVSGYRDEVFDYRNEVLAEIGAVGSLVQQEVTSWGTATRNALLQDVQTYLLTNYYTINDTQVAIAGAISSLGSQFSNDLSVLTSTLTTDYYTASQIDNAISSATLALRTQMEGPAGSVGQLSATLVADYYTVTEVNLALANLTQDLNAQIASTTATLLNDYYTKAQTDSAISSATTSLTTTVNGLSTTVSQVQTSVNGVTGTYGLQVNNNGHISGFGLISSLVAGTPVSDFTISADSFKMVAASGGTPYTPFAVYGAPRVVDGVTIPAGVHAQDLYVLNANIGNAQITNAKIKSGEITADKLNVTQLSAVSATIGILRTATSGARMEIHSDKILVYDVNNVLRVRLGNMLG